MVTPAGTEAASQHPQQLVPGAKPSAWSGSSWAGEDGNLVAQEQVLEDEVVARAHPGQDGREQQPEEFEHAFSIVDWRPSEVLPSHSGTVRGRAVAAHELFVGGDLALLGALNQSRLVRLSLVHFSLLLPPARSGRQGSVSSRCPVHSLYTARGRLVPAIRGRRFG